MKKNKLLFLMLILVITIFTSKGVYAESINVSLDYLSYNNGSRNLWAYKHINNRDDPYYKIRANSNVAYCMEVGADLDPKYPYDSDAGLTLDSYLEGKVSTSKKANLIKQLNNYLYFGYKAGDTYSDDNEAVRYELATQKLIWDAIYDAGYRTDHYTKNMVYYLGEYPLDAENQPRHTPYTASLGDVAVQTEMNAINSKINTYKKTPSFCSSSVKLEIALGETATYTDSNKVLSKFQVTCSDGIKCEVDGNKLTVTAKKVGADHKITFTKSGSGTGAKVYAVSGQQAIIIGGGEVAPVSCDFGIDTYENVQTGSFQVLLFSLIGLASFFVGYTIFATRNKKDTNQSA